MKHQAEPDELYLAQTENRQLRDTVAALRGKLEEMRFDKERSIHKAVAVANDEIAQLKATAIALRDELEHNKLAHEATMQELGRTSRDERTQLQ